MPQQGRSASKHCHSQSQASQGFTQVIVLCLQVKFATNNSRTHTHISARPFKVERMRKLHARHPDTIYCIKLRPQEIHSPKYRPFTRP